MNQFDQAKAKFDRKRAQVAQVSAPTVELEKKEEPKKQEEQRKPKAGPMVVTVTGPANITLEIDYAGTLLGSQVNEKSLRELLKKHLSALGRVR